MTVDIHELQKHVGRSVELRFNDGYVARVRLIDADPDSAPNELIYDVLEVLNWGGLDPGKVDLESAHAASVADLASWRVVP